MSRNLGDFIVGGTVDFKFNTVNADGSPAALTSGAVSVYKDNGTTESTSGVTLTSTFDSRTGMHHVRITLSSDGTFYSAGSRFSVVLTTGSVGSTSVIGSVLAEFSIAMQTPPMLFAAGPIPLLGILESGTAQSATATTLRMRAGSVLENDVAIGATVHVVSATTGAGQSAVVTDLDSATDTLSLRAWSGGITPTGTITYVVYATAPVEWAGDELIDDIADAVGTRQIPDSYAAAGAQPTMDQALLLSHQATRDLRQKPGSPNTLQVMKPDGSTPSGVELVLDSFSAPTTRSG